MNEAGLVTRQMGEAIVTANAGWGDLTDGTNILDGRLDETIKTIATSVQYCRSKKTQTLNSNNQYNFIGVTC